MQVKVGKPRKIVTFLGAGASAPFKYPTTKSFLEGLEGFLTGEEKKYLNSIRSLYWVVEDVEHVVEILDSILELESASQRTRLSTFLFWYPVFLDFVKKDDKRFYFSPSLEEKVGWSQLVKLSEGLRDQVEEFTFQQYESKVVQFPRIKREYARFFSMLKNYLQENEFEVFTTNYDNVIEDFSCKSGISCMLSVLDHEVNPRVENHEYNLLLTKLHGSLNWLIDKETGNIEISNSQARVRKGSPRWDRNEYVLFGTKARLGEAKIYQPLLDQLTQSLLKAKFCVVIGFSFRDKHITEIFNNALLQNSQLRLLIVSRSPKEAAKNLIPQSGQLKNLMKQKRIITLRCSFGTSRAINQMSVTLSSMEGEGR
jgi:hypothetical protein